MTTKRLTASPPWSDADLQALRRACQLAAVWLEQPNIVAKWHAREWKRTPSAIVNKIMALGWFSRGRWDWGKLR